jgi:hypothetical protein
MSRIKLNESSMKMLIDRKKTAHNERFGATAAVTRMQGKYKFER